MPPPGRGLGSCNGRIHEPPSWPQVGSPEVSTVDLVPQELRTLVAVAEEGGFSAAAVRLGTTQSAVSHAVRGMERKLGVVLFERGRFGARPTPAGARAVSHGRRVLRMLDV